MKLPEAIRRLFDAKEAWAFIGHDQVPLTVVAYEPECPVDQVHGVNGFVLVPHVLARRLPEPTGTMQTEKGTVPCWKLADLESDGARGTN